MEAQQCVELTGTNRPRTWQLTSVARARCVVLEVSGVPELQSVSVAIAEGRHPVPYRTRKLSPPAPMVLPGKLGGRVGRRRDPSRTAPPEGGAVRLSPGEQTVGAASAKEEWQRSHGRRATAMCGVGGRPRWEVDDAQGSGVPERGGARRACAGIAGGSRRRRHGNRVRPDRRLSGDGGWYPAVPRLDLGTGKIRCARRWRLRDAPFVSCYEADVAICYVLSSGGRVAWWWWW